MTLQPPTNPEAAAYLADLQARGREVRALVRPDAQGRLPPEAFLALDVVQLAAELVDILERGATVIVEDVPDCLSPRMRIEGLVGQSWYLAAAAAEVARTLVGFYR